MGAAAGLRPAAFPSRAWLSAHDQPGVAAAHAVGYVATGHCSQARCPAAHAWLSARQCHLRLVALESCTSALWPQMRPLLRALSAMKPDNVGDVDDVFAVADLLDSFLMQVDTQNTRVAPLTAQRFAGQRKKDRHARRTAVDLASGAF
jgi:hypothetical protein